MKNDPRTSPRTIATRTVSMIFAGATWEEVCADVNLSKQTIQKYLWQSHYKGGKDSVAYRKLLEMAKQNSKAKRVQTDFREIHIVEPGYIINAGVEAVQKMAAKKSVVIPLFCVGELKKLSQNFTVAADFLKNCDSVTPLFIKHERLYVEPDYDVEWRIRGIVALAVDLHSMGMNVTVHTNSHKVRLLCELQKIGTVEVLK